MIVTKIPFETTGDNRGSLIAIEGAQTVPFEIRRVYYIWGTGKGVTRGHHAHITLQQVLVCVHGACTIVLDDGKDRRDVRLDSPCEGLFIGPFMWREMKDFTSDAVLLVIASEHYEESDYIRNYKKFLTKTQISGGKD